MYTIKENSHSKIEIKKSIFIIDIIKVQSEEDILLQIEEIKKKYKDATHYCYAYILGEKKHFSDDNEPSGTAGMPILNVLEKKKLNYILCVVTRYFGGILLGAGGLVRAYTKGATEALKNASITSLVAGYNLRLTFPYDNIKQIDFLLKNIKINRKSFTEKIIYEITISKNDFSKYEMSFKQLCDNVIILKNCFL